MISFFAYKEVHLIAVLGLFLAFGSIIAEQAKSRFTAMLHGLTLLFILMSGFGMLARLGFAGSIPSWALGKLVIWFLMGGSIVLARRSCCRRARYFFFCSP